jgi:glycerol transport system ATP-binding protein
MAAIRIRGLGHTYPGAAPPSLEGLDLDIAPGEAHALLGASGAGKTTLLHLLAGLLEPTTGVIAMDGIDVTHRSGVERNIAQVFQFPVLYPAMRVGANLAFPLETRGWTRAAARARAGEVAELLDIGHLLARKPGQLSLFEKQLVAIGRALVRPDVAMVLLDEPLTAVQPSIKWRLRSALKRVQRELGLTMVYVTHDQIEALTFADRISMLMHGRILQTGTPLELYERPAMAEVATFIGTPGMNLLPGDVRGNEYRIAEHAVAPAYGIADGDCTIGFRPEWATVGNAGVPVTVAHLRATGTRAGRVEALVTLDCMGVRTFSRQVLDGDLPKPACLHIDPAHVVGFRDGRRLDIAPA